MRDISDGSDEGAQRAKQLKVNKGSLLLWSVAPDREADANLLWAQHLIRKVVT